MVPECGALLLLKRPVVPTPATKTAPFTKSVTKRPTALW